ncbi:MAG: intracellular multiplication protein IcmK [Marinobacter sp. T13-3]|nr:MAG: intracellular multiplication protein IcmK [Marinobacter sp. T13-3]
MHPRKIMVVGAFIGAIASTPAVCAAQDQGDGGNARVGAQISNLNENTDPRMQEPPVDLSTIPSDMDMLFPLTPEERVRIRERQLKDQNATYKPLRDVKPLRELISISGNADTIPEVYVTPDYPTSVVFSDITGKPWPIQFIGQTGTLANVVQPEGSDNAMVLMAKNGAGKKSVTVFLKGLSLPITLTVTGRNNDYHALKHIRITERGPNSSWSRTAQSGSRGSAPDLDPTEGAEDGSLDEVLNKLAYKVTPEGYQKLQSSDPRVDAWISKSNNKYMYVRTDYTVVAPAPRAGNRGVTPLQDDVRIYVLPRINPIMALDETGQRQYLTFKE